MGLHGETRINSQFLDCIEKCLYCCITCGKAHYGLAGTQSGEAFAPIHLPLLECARICGTTANFLSYGSVFWKAACGHCADICEECAGEYAQTSGNEKVRAAAEGCRECAAACRELAEQYEPFAKPARGRTARGWVWVAVRPSSGN